MSVAITLPIAETRPVSAVQPQISIVMPCLNEAETLAKCIQKAQTALAEHGVTGEIIIADNGSTDGSQAIAASFGIRIVEVQEKGYGSALRGGIEAARAEYVLMGDADDSYDFGHLNRFLEALDAGADLVMGNRFRGGIGPDAMPPLHRYLGNPVLSGLGRLFFRCPVGDFHCGLRAFRKGAYQRMELRGSGMEFASEMVVRASLLGMRVAEVPTTLVKDGRHRQPHLRSWRDGWRHLRFLLLYSPRFLFFIPGYLLMLIGAIVFVKLLAGPVRIGRVEFDVDTMLFAAAAILIGFQVVSFAIFARIVGVTQGLLPPNKILERIFQWITLEVGLVIGLILSVAGLAECAAAIVFWKDRAFGAVNPAQMIRLVSPGILGLTIGVETIFASFFLSLLGYVRKK